MTDTDVTRESGRRAGRWIAVAVLVAFAFAAGLFFKDAAGRWMHRGHGHAEAGGAAGQLWTCSMHPQVIREEPGICPICHMALEPMSVVKAGGSAMGGGGGGTELVIDPVVVQNMGVRFAQVAEQPLRAVVRATGTMQEPEPAHREINLRVSGWIEKLYADTDGMPVEEGKPLFELYSPEVQVAVEELIAARRSRDRLGGGGAAAPDELARRTDDALYGAARRKLALWGLTGEQVDELSKRERAPRTVAILSPMTGHLTEKMVYEGAAVKAGERVMRLADRSTMWLDVRVFEGDLAHVEPGQKVTAAVAAAPGRAFEGEVMFIHPHLDAGTRTALVRVSLPNPGHTLRQGMYATARIESEVSPKALVVPREAVIDTGERQIVFVAKDGGRFEPRRVELGAGGADGVVQVLSGLAAGERVVTSGQFLLDAESRLKEAIQKHLDEKLLAKAGNADREGEATAVNVSAPAQLRAAGRVAASDAATRKTAVEAGPDSGGQNLAADAPAARRLQQWGEAPAEPRSAARWPARQGVAKTQASIPSHGESDESGDRWKARVDDVVSRYLEVARVLGAKEERAEAVDAGPLVESAEALMEAARGGPREGAARAVAESATAFASGGGEERRARFKPLSGAVIALVGQSPPSPAVAGKLYVMHCPMADKDRGADWLQREPAVANPYYAKDMKGCGSVEKTIELAP